MAYFGGLCSEAQVKAQKKYDSENTKRYSLKLNLKTDKDIIEWTWYQRSVQGSIKRLIREEIEKNKAKTKNI